LIIQIIFVRGVQVMKLLIMQFSAISRHFISLRSRYSPQHPVIKHPQSVFLPWFQRPSFTPTQNQRQNYSFVYSNFYVLSGTCLYIPTLCFGKREGIVYTWANLSYFHDTWTVG
jgi:hypothetical protein